MLSTDFERWNKMKRQRDNDNNLSGELCDIRRTLRQNRGLSHDHSDGI